MFGPLPRCVLRFLTVGIFSLSLTGLAGAQTPPSASPIEDIQATLATILSAITNLQTTVNGLPTGVDLRGVTQNWDKKLDSTNGDAIGCNSERFTCLWPDGNGNPTAVRDNETGNVWERSPLSNLRHWAAAAGGDCNGRIIGGRGGWHAPSMSQLTSLLDPSVGTAPQLPLNHPFLNVTDEFELFVTTQSLTSSSGQNIFVALQLDTSPNFQGLGPFASSVGVANNSDVREWCVRGGEETGNGIDGRSFVPLP